ncbi:hypothetical protein PILCRDRAFT_1576 [Piloderma croceum F 1598]|uniref:Uncharacterized protein n=1 Tax=Piloderma croceum (strain F 1598) TaxID=765440 RepID=A0A0C3CKN7_PILCF|nr:hypothetical protein PILCRDRAFT_1576 [Piloderma croceum F 1598]
MLYHHACQAFRFPQLDPYILAESVFLQKTIKGTDVGSERYRYTPVPFNALEDASSLASYLLLTVRVDSEPSGVSDATVVRFVVAWAHLHNITLESTAPEIVWSPALCNVSLNDSNCISAWRVSEDVLGAEITSTNGPDSVTGDIIPQMFLSFRGSAIYIRTSPQSTATVNVSFSSPSVAMHTDAQVNSSIGWISAVNLSEDVAFTITITYVPNFGSQDGDGGRLDIQFIILTVSNISAISSFLPSMALPSSSTPPISSPSQVLTTTPSTRRQSKGAIIGESAEEKKGKDQVERMGVGGPSDGETDDKPYIGVLHVVY